jgi:hypothetical protein
MLLSARVLDQVLDVNHFTNVNQITFVQGDTVTLYLQLIDASRPRANYDPANPAGFRYVPFAGATLQVLIQNLDDLKKINRFATQPFPNDASIWAVPFLPTDNFLRGTPSIQLILNEGGKLTSCTLQQAVMVQLANQQLGYNDQTYKTAGQ